MTILITGSSGHLGEAIARVLTEKGLKFIGVDINASEYTTHVGSITNRQFVRAVMQGVDYIRVVQK